MLRDIIRQLAQEYGVPIIMDEKANLELGDFKFEIMLPSSVSPGDVLVVVCDRGPNLWLSGLAEEGQIILAKSPELRYMREIENGG